MRDEQGHVVDFKWIYENAAIARLNGKNPAAVIGRRLLEIIPSHADSPFDKAYQQVAETGQPCVLEAPFHGETIAEGKWFRVAVVPSGQDIAILAQDITERKQTENALQTSAQRFHSALASMYGSILLVRNEGIVEFANQSFCDLFNLKVAPGDLIGVTADEIIGRIKDGCMDPEGAVIRIQEIAGRDQPVRGEEVVLRDGRICLRDFIPIVLGGEHFGRLWHHMDITERKRAEEALRRQQGRFRRSWRTPRPGWSCLMLLHHTKCWRTTALSESVC